MTQVLVLSALVALGGCDNKSDAKTTDTPANVTQKAQELDPCTMPTKEELVAVLTQPAADPERRGGAAVKQCSWWSESEDRYVVVQLILQLTAPPGTPDGYGWSRAKFDEVWGQNAKSLSGLFDVAWFNVESDGATLYLLKGSLAFSVGLVFYRTKDRPSEETLLASLKPLAQAIGSRAANG